MLIVKTAFEVSLLIELALVVHVKHLEVCLLLLDSRVLLLDRFVFNALEVQPNVVSIHLVVDVAQFAAEHVRCFFIRHFYFS